jgi:hypothetical protein
VSDVELRGSLEAAGYKGADLGTRNFVLFDPSIAKILDRK